MQAAMFANVGHDDLLSQFTNSVRLWVMDKVEYTEAERWLIEPKPGTAAARARDYGVDLSETVRNLRLTPAARVKKLDEWQFGNIPFYSDVRAGFHFDTAMLLELEAILEYQQFIAKDEE